MDQYPQALVIVVPSWLIVVGLVAAGAGVAWRLKAVPRNWKAVSVEVEFAGLGKVTIEPNRDDVQIAHRAWVELATRKAGVPFDPTYDVIVEVYDSWYELFGRLRELARECPATKMRTDPSTRQLVATLTQVLNRGMRPHLTRWQAEFRRWYALALEKAAPETSPQEVQRQFPQYDQLVAELITVQEGLQRYMALLRELATGE